MTQHQTVMCTQRSLSVTDSVLLVTYRDKKCDDINYRSITIVF